jgi:Tol biopolymer transport system component
MRSPARIPALALLRRPVLAALLGVSVALVLAGVAVGASGRPAGRIYYAGPAQACVADESSCAPPSAVWSIAPDGSQSRFESSFSRILFLNNSLSLPAISHQGRLFVFAQYSATGLHTDLVVVSRNGGTIRQLSTPNGWNASPAWSPNDHWIAFSSLSGYAPSSATTIWVVRASGGAPHRVAKAAYSAWSPDGRWITFPRQVTPRGPFELWAVSITGTGLHRLTHLGLRGSDGPTFVWSPRGRLAVATSGGIFIADRRLRRLTRVAGRGAYNPVFSPHGSTLLFTRESSTPAAYRGGVNSNSIYSVGADGRGLRRITRGAHFDQDPAWSPDGHWISFSRDESLWTVSSQGGSPSYVPHQARHDLGYTPYNALSIWLP